VPTPRGKTGGREGGNVYEEAAKKATYAVVRDRDVTDEELITVFAGMESLLNSS